MAASGNYDVIVIGAGIEGSSAAYHLVKNGKRVLLLEQFPLPHTRGSSHGQSRILSYCESDEVYVKMILDSMSIWATLEQEYGQNFITQCGGLELRQEGSPGCQMIANTLMTHNLPYEIISPGDFRLRFPMFNVKDNIGALFNPAGVTLKADKALNAFQTIFKKLGGILVDGCPVMSVLPGASVKVVTPKAIYSAKNVVITAGPWTGKFTSALGLNVPIKPCKATVFYWKASEDKVDLYHFTKMPNFVDFSVDENQYHCYGLAIEEYPGLVKVCLHAGPQCDPDHRDQADTQGVEEQAIQQIQRLFPWLEHKPSVIEYCIVTKTPDNNPYIDRHPKYPNIAIAGGFSGYGFQLAPAIGKTLTELVLGLNPTYKMELFRLDRFNLKPKM